MFALGKIAENGIKRKQSEFVARANRGGHCSEILALGFQGKQRANISNQQRGAHNKPRRRAGRHRIKTDSTARLCQ